MPDKILFIRRDNIGDLICTTPAIRAVRERFPLANIGILVNSYNADAVAGNPDINDIYVYEKAKHSPHKSRLSVWLSNLRVLYKIRRERYDIAFACGSASPRLARYALLTGAAKTVGYVSNDNKRSVYSVALSEPQGRLHEVERTFHLVSSLGITERPGPMRVFPNPAETEAIGKITDSGQKTIAFHISSRRPENRWPASSFVELGDMIMALGHNVMLLWSPGSEKNVRHPGDDEKAEVIAKNMRKRPIMVDTSRLSELIAALSLADAVVCSDGGAMHIAAALNKPLAVIWGSTDKARWAPWAARHVIVDSNMKNASKVAVSDVYKAVRELMSLT